MREEFEVWASINGLAGATAIAWQAWQASRAALCVELPTVTETMNLVFDYQHNKKLNVTGTTNWAANIGSVVVDSCRTAIESAGIRTK